MAELNPAARVYPEGHEGDSNYEAPCMWFARCTNPANGVANAGPLGNLPICARCATKVGITEFVNK